MEKIAQLIVNAPWPPIGPAQTRAANPPNGQSFLYPHEAESYTNLYNAYMIQKHKASE